MTARATWGLVVETTVGAGDRKHTEAQVVAHVVGSRREALAELERRARVYEPTHPLSPKRRRLLRTSDGFLLVVDGAWQSIVTRFLVAELLADSDAPEPPAPGPVAEEPVQEKPAAPPPPAEPVEVDDDGVPVRPGWLGRTDLP
ncbi:hypothetical protein GTW59_01900 [Streptomyces sp. SID89]|nr:hypothetical protein [Streptomyces sp. SID89]